MQPKVTIPFIQRGLPGLLGIVLGLTPCFVFRHSSPWPDEVKHLMFQLAMVLAMGGSALVSSYVWQRPWQAMRSELLAIATMLTCMPVLF